MSLLRKILQPLMIVAPYVLRNSQTSAYPTERLMFSDRFRGRHKYFFDRCISCGICAKICPDKSITMIKLEKRPLTYPQFNYQTCSFCGYCVEYCPKKAIEFTDFVEFAETNWENLIYSPEKLVDVPDIKKVLPMLKRRTEAFLTKTEMKYRKVRNV
jgi:formate hydrogenlyase subunit 6/NADH:ubiquinone oxidoreductase subunit I